MTKRIGIVVVFLVGCAVGGASSQLVVPKASAQQAAQLTKWEYACVEARPRDVEPAARKFGAEGFEMVGLSARTNDLSHLACFKRPKM